jgi:DHA1 family multidrug resistance protein-like MFS transporter
MRPKRLLENAAGTDPVAVRVVGALVVAVFVQGVGASAVLPLLPLFMRGHGTSDALVGAVMGSFFVAGVLTQYGAGHLADRFGHRRVITGGLVIYAVASLGYLASVSPGGYVGLRSLQGVGGGAVQVASLALVGVVVPVERRGRAFSALFGAQLAGMAIGPLAGSVAGLAHLRWLFIATAAMSLVSIVPVVVGTAPAPEPAPSHERPPALTVSRALVGVALVGVSAGLVTGVYEACWSLLMSSRGAHPWQIGLSWTLFAVPFAAFSPTAGRLADRLDRRRLVIGALLASSVFAALYPFLPSVAWLMSLGVIEAIAVAVAFPAAQSMLTQTATPETLGRAQGLFTTAESAAIAMAAAASGALFGVARWVPFVAASVLGGLIVGVLPALWRGLPGRADPDQPLRLPGSAEGLTAGAIPSTAPTA